MLANAVRWRESVRIGPFTATFDPRDDNRYLNYAVPDEGAEPSPRDVAALVDASRARTRLPRLEYIAQLAPAVEPVLLAAGFEAEGRLPLMSCAGPDAVHPRAVDGIELVTPRSDEHFRAAADVQSEAFGGDGGAHPHAVEALKRTAGAGGVVVLARDARSHEPAGAGTCTSPEDGLTELTSVAVRPAFRRRGIAEALTARLAEEAFAAGMTGVFLMAAGEAQERIYGRAGFARVGEILHISLPRTLA